MTESTPKQPMTLEKAHDVLLHVRGQQVIQSDFTDALDVATNLMHQLLRAMLPVEEVNMAAPTSANLDWRFVEMQSNLDEARGDATVLANAWRDLFNTNGADEDVRAAYEAVERHVDHWEGRE